MSDVAVSSPSNGRWTERDVYRPETPAWKAAAECSELPVDMFYVDVGGPAPDKVAAAKAVCDRCPVRQECLDYAVTNNERWGIWGGLTYTERRTVRRQRFGNRDTPQVIRRRAEAVHLASIGIGRVVIAERLGISVTTVDRYLRDAAT